MFKSGSAKIATGNKQRHNSSYHNDIGGYQILYMEMARYKCRDDIDSFHNDIGG